MSILYSDKIITMDPNIKARWVADLRSGHFRQGRSKLKDARLNYCCLGVLCEQAASNEIVVEKQWRDDYHSDDFYFEDNGFKANNMLPPAVSLWAGLVNQETTTTMGVMPFSGRREEGIYLDDLNDSGMPFNQIADLIEYMY